MSAWIYIYGFSNPLGNLRCKMHLAARAGLQVSFKGKTKSQASKRFPEARSPSWLVLTPLLLFDTSDQVGLVLLFMRGPTESNLCIRRSF